MHRSLSTLGVVDDSYEMTDWVRTRWFRQKAVVRTITFLDWTIDGVPLRDLLRYSDGSVPGEVTVLGNDWAAPGVGSRLVKTLLGDSSPSTFETVMPDGRAALLFCPIDFDINCATVTAEVVLGDDVVEWRDLGWQVEHDPFNLSDSDFEPLTIAFDRVQYVAELERLLALERARVLGTSGVTGRRSRGARRS